MVTTAIIYMSGPTSTSGRMGSELNITGGFKKHLKGYVYVGGFCMKRRRNVFFPLHTCI